MGTKLIRLEQHTRHEFKEALNKGHFEVAIIATGSIEQHLEHLAINQDIFSSTYMAETVADLLYPKVIVAVPISIGIAEHHMYFPGTMSAKPGSWLAILFDAVESLIRHGITKILILNGHGGNVLPVKGVIQQWQLHLTSVYGNPINNTAKPIDSHEDYTDALLERDSTGLDLRFNSYWDFIPEEYTKDILEIGKHPGHAGEFETSFALEAFPENVRQSAINKNKDPEPKYASSDKGRLLIDKAIQGITYTVNDMLKTE
tara:strand:- start:8008 stop:8784 length:777 start_codon:yes stop_codon:yes gene_type:complete